MAYKDKENQKSYYRKNSETYKWKQRLGRVNISKEDFYNLLEKQEGACALCKKPFLSIWGNSCHVDHCHETGRVRGLLCLACNVGLGMLGDNEEGLNRALIYVKGNS